MPEVGEVYWDNTLNREVEILAVSEDGLKIKHERMEELDYRRWMWEHNASLGRYKKLRDESHTEEEEVAEKGPEKAEKQSVFDL